MSDSNQRPFVGNQVIIAKGTPAPPPAGTLAIISQDGTNLLKQASDGTTSSLGGGGGGDFTAIMKDATGSPPASGISLASIFSGGAGLLKVAADGTVSKAVPGTDYLTTCEVTAFPTQTISVETDTVTFSGLSGDTDGIYEFDIVAICGTGCTSAGGSITINFNGTTTNQQCQSEHISGTGTPAHAAFGNSTKAVVGLEAVAGQTATCHIRVYPKSGAIRMAKWNAALYDATANSIQTFNGTAFWSDTATPVTSIVFKDAVNKFFGVGSVISGRKIAT